MFSFSKRKKVVDLASYIRRLCDLTAPNMPTAYDARSQNRYNRAIPTLLCPWQDDLPRPDASIFGITSDLSDRGVGLIINQPFHADTMILAYWLSSEIMAKPWFFLANVRRNQSIGGGFWAVGIEFFEFANADSRYNGELAVLEPLAAKLVSPTRLASECATELSLANT